MNVYTELIEGENREIESERKIMVAGRTMNERGGQEMMIYTDGSAELGCENGVCN